MTEFKAPPPPPGNFGAPSAPAEPATPEVAETEPVSQEAVAPAAETPVADATEKPVEEQPTTETTEEATSETPNNVAQTLGNVTQQLNEKKALVKKFLDKLTPVQRQGLFVGCGVLFGIILGAVMFSGGSADNTPIIQGLQGVVSNPDITQPLKRCGMVEDASAACILYVMNSQPYDKLAKDFFENATAITGRSTTAIGWDNVRYGGLKIPAGYFAQIKIPARK